MIIFKNFFKLVPLWQIIILNAIVGFISSAPFLFALILLSGGLAFYSSPSIYDKMISIIILAAICLVILLSNIILYKYRVKNNEPSKEDGFHCGHKISFLKCCITMIVLFLTVGSFFLLPDIWLWFNSFWF